MTDEYAGEPTEAPEQADAAAEVEDKPAQYGVGPFTIREIVILGIWLVAFVVSFFSIVNSAGLMAGGASVWTAGLEWILTIGVPTVAVFLIVLRRFSPEGIRRVGSLAIDQFASVAFSVAAVIWLTWLWRNIASAIASGQWIYSWVVWVEFFLMLAGVVVTVFAPFIPPFADDFRDRPEVVAHRSARPVRPVVARPRVQRTPVVAEEAVYGPTDYTAADAAGYGAAGYAAAEATASPAQPATDDATWSPSYARGGDTGGYARASAEPAEPAAAQPTGAHQAFWALSPDERDVHDERGIPIFRVGPTAWALVIEDRGSVYVIRHEDGRIGYLHETSGVTRG